MHSILLVCLTTFAFAGIHSLLASRRCKRWFETIGLVEPRYRLVYSILSVVLTIFWVTYIHSLPDVPLYRADGLLFYTLLMIQILGGGMVMAAFRPIDSMAFLGIRAVGNNVDPFIVSGIYRHMRHPMYSGAMLILLASPWQSFNGLSMALLVSLYFLAGSRLEERRMIEQHPEYIAYRQQVPAFVPRPGAVF